MNTQTRYIGFVINRPSTFGRRRQENWLTSQVTRRYTHDRMTCMVVSGQDDRDQTILVAGYLNQVGRSNRWWPLIALCSISLLCPTLVRAQSRSVQPGPKVTEVLDTGPLDIKDEDTQLIKLKKMRFNAAIAEAKERYALFKKGQAKFPDLVDVGQRVLTAQADLAQSPEERAQVLDKQLQVFAEAEDNLDKQVKEGKGQAADLDRLRYERFGVEIDLEILRKGMSQ
ncbi:MAG TPA: hypothetical protein VFO40_11350 [Chthoniobacterales bacterium]|nr:hypothetical protein [Chthoniobacterales bacterium]